MRTLFDIKWYEKSRRGRPGTYPLQLEGAYATGQTRTVDDTELSIFRHAVEHETPIYEPRGFLSGKIEFKANYPEAFAGESPYSGQYARLPTCAEPELVTIESCDATGILLVESISKLEMLAGSSALNKLRLAVMATSGIPRFAARRFLRRLQIECGLQVHVLLDNDTWSYFIYSVLLRGAIAPHLSFPLAAVQAVNYVGIRSDDFRLFGIKPDKLRGWKDLWSLRLDALANYECFKSHEWQKELSRFREQRCAVNLVDFIESFGNIDLFVNNFIAPRL